MPALVAGIDVERAANGRRSVVGARKNHLSAVRSERAGR
jgi:hypothetical protein